MLSDYIDMSNPIAFTALNFISCLTGVPPASTTNFAAGLYHGVLYGTALFLFSAALAAIAALVLVRVGLEIIVQHDAAILRRWEAKRIALDAAIEKEGALTIVTLLRLSPAMPLAPANILLGLTSVSIVPYTLGTIIGLAPFSAVYAYIGSVSQTAAAGSGDSTQMALQICGVLATIGLTWKISKVAQAALDSATGPIRRTSRKSASPVRRQSATIDVEIAPRGGVRQRVQRRPGTTVATARPSSGGKDSDPARAAAMNDEWKARLVGAGIDPKTGRRRSVSPARAAQSPSRRSRKTTADI